MDDEDEASDSSYDSDSNKKKPTVKVKKKNIKQRKSEKESGEKEKSKEKDKKSKKKSNTKRRTRRTTYIYVLLCQEDKYYVGKTKDLERRMEEHFSEDGATWTKLYEPVKLVETHRARGMLDENITTLQMMDKHGIENVRGGSFCYTRIGKIRRAQLEEKIQQMKDGEYKGEEKYYSKRRRKMISITKTVSVSNKDSNGEKKVKRVRKKVVYGVICKRCGRKNHKEDTCFANTHKDGTVLCEVCGKCGRRGHEEDDCYAKTTKSGKKIK